MSSATEVLIPDSQQAAVDAYGDGSDITVIGGGTILVPMITSGWVRPSRALLLNQAGLSFVRRDGAQVTVGSMTPISDLEGEAAPLGSCAANVGDLEIRGQGTIGGNLCAPNPPEHPTGDLQGALLALDAIVRSTGAGGERVDSVEDFLAARDGRLVLDVSYNEPAAGAFQAFQRPHAHHPSPVTVSAARTDGGVRIAATGVGETAIRLTSAEASADDPEAAGAAAVADAQFRDDAVASAWYREQILPVLVRRTLSQLQEAS